MAYSKQSWQDAPSTATPITAVRLAHLEDGIAAATTSAESALAALPAKADLVNGVLSPAQLPALSTTETFAVASQPAMLALPAQPGDFAVRTDISETYILVGADPTKLANWTQLLHPAAGISLATADARYELLGAAATERTRATTAEALLAPKASPTFTGTVSGITKAMVGLGNVDNVSDVNKPVSAAVKAQLDIKANQDSLDAAIANLSDDISQIGSQPNPSNLVPVYYNDATGWPTVDAATLLLPIVWINGTVAPPQARFTGANYHIWLKADGQIVTYVSRFDFESYASAAALDTVAQSSGQQWDAIANTGTGVSATAVATPVYAGTRAGKYATGATAAQVWTAWRARGSLTENTMSAMFYITAYPSANATLLRRRVQTSPGVFGSSSGVRMTPTGMLDFMDASFNVMFSTTTAVPLNTWFVVEDHRVASATAANCRANAWVQWVGGSVIALGDDTTARVTGPTLDEEAVGILSNVANFNLYVDEVRLGATGRQFGPL